MKNGNQNLNNQFPSQNDIILPFQKNNNFLSPIWLSVSEAAKLGGVSTKTIRRSLQGKQVRYKIIKNRYLIDLASLIIFLHSKKKLLNKLSQFGLGQYIEKWLD